MGRIKFFLINFSLLLKTKLKFSNPKNSEILLFDNKTIKLSKIDKNKSGICHHMIFETKYIDELISGMEKNHNDLFYNIFLKTVTDKEGSGASEYEIYFNPHLCTEDESCLSLGLYIN